MRKRFVAILGRALSGYCRFASQAEARMACLSFIAGWYNLARPDPAVRSRSPIAHEATIEDFASIT